MQWPAEPSDDHVTRAEVLAFIEQYGAALTLRDVRGWYAEAFGDETLNAALNSRTVS
jgi:hypothetical protein